MINMRQHKLPLLRLRKNLAKAEKLEQRDGKSIEVEKPNTYEQAGMIG